MTLCVRDEELHHSWIGRAQAYIHLFNPSIRQGSSSEVYLMAGRTGKQQALDVEVRSKRSEDEVISEINESFSVGD